MQAFIRFETRDRRDAGLRLVQEVGRGTERAPHRAVVERDQTNRPDFGKLRLARGLRRQRADTVRGLQPFPVRRVRHLFIRSAVDRVAQFQPAQRTLGYGQNSSIPGSLGRSSDAAQGVARAQSRHQFEQRAFALAQNHQIERTQFEHQLRTKSRFHAAGNDKRMRGHAAREVRKFQVESQRHPRGGDTDDVPAAGHQLPLQCALRCVTAAVWIEHAGHGARRFEYAREPPHTQRRG